MAEKQFNLPTRYPVPVSQHSADKKILAESYRLSALASDKASKRVIAPFVRTIKRSEKLAREKSKEEFSYYLHKRPVAVLQDLSEFLSDSVDLPSLLHETADVLKSVTKSTGVVLYMVDSALGEIWQHPRYIISPRHKVNWKIRTGETIASYVAHQKEFIIVEDILGDSRFPLGVGWRGPLVKSVLCVPVVTPDDDCIAVIELYREVNEEVYTKTDLQIVVAVTGWMGAAIHQNQQRMALQKQQELNDYLLDLTKCYFADVVFMDKIISEIVVFAKETLGAERGSFFIIDPECDELVADLFDEGIGTNTDGSLRKRKLKIRFSKERGIAGLVARTGETVNIKDAYNDPRFNKEVDIQTGFITRSILCMPIMGRDGVLGVVQLVNKKNSPCFTKSDENIFKTFSVYCALALHYSRLQDQMKKVDTRNDIKTEMLTFHMRPCSHDMERMLSLKVDPLPGNFTSFLWYVNGFEDKLCHLLLHMFQDLSGNTFQNLESICEFVLTMKKSYRMNPYHNFEHAFNFTHCMYNILQRNSDIFTPLEKIGLMMASYGHDVDHQGLTNNFLRLVDHSLSQLYPESSLENHHFQVTMLIVNSVKLFENWSPQLYKELTQEIHDAIIATDLAFYFRCRAKLADILSEKEFDWTNGSHRILLKSIMMTTCDLSGQCKPFHITKQVTESVYREFYRQGDIEKSMGHCPLSMMDREKQDMIAEDQMQFISVVCLPCMEILSTLLPNCEELYISCKEVHDQWKEIKDMKGKVVWKPEESVIGITK